MGNRKKIYNADKQKVYDNEVKNWKKELESNPVIDNQIKIIKKLDSNFYTIGMAFGIVFILQAIILYGVFK